jgi:hypothetical protein
MHLGFEYRPIADGGYVDKRVIIAISAFTTVVAPWPYF